MENQKQEGIKVGSVIIRMSEKYLMIKLVIWAFILLFALSTIGLLLSGFEIPSAFFLAIGVTVYTLAALLIIFIWKSTYYELKARAITIRKGIIRKRKTEVDLRLYGGAYLERGMMGRIFGFGTIVLEHRLGPNTDSTIALFNIEDPEKHFETLSAILQGIEPSE